jgi:hypothetical protein
MPFFLSFRLRSVATAASRGLSRKPAGVFSRSREKLLASRGLMKNPRPRCPLTVNKIDRVHIDFLNPKVLSRVLDLSPVGLAVNS